MKLSKEAIERINSRPTILKLALALEFSEVWVERLIAANKNNGPLTTMKAVQTIIEETGLDESRILEVEQVKG